MASKAIPLVFHCKTPAGWKRLPVAWHSNGKLRAHHAQAGGKQVEYHEGHYEVRCYVEGKRVWRNVGEVGRPGQRRTTSAWAPSILRRAGRHGRYSQAGGLCDHPALRRGRAFLDAGAFLVPIMPIGLFAALETYPPCACRPGSQGRFGWSARI